MKVGLLKSTLRMMSEVKICPGKPGETLICCPASSFQQLAGINTHSVLEHIPVHGHTCTHCADLYSVYILQCCSFLNFLNQPLPYILKVSNKYVKCFYQLFIEGIVYHTQNNCKTMFIEKLNVSSVNLQTIVL